jgi:hypothetical protein
MLILNQVVMSWAIPMCSPEIRRGIGHNPSLDHLEHTQEEFTQLRCNLIYKRFPFLDQHTNKPQHAIVYIKDCPLPHLVTCHQSSPPHIHTPHFQSGSSFAISIAPTSCHQPTRGASVHRFLYKYRPLETRSCRCSRRRHVIPRPQS